MRKEAVMNRSDYGRHARGYRTPDGSGAYRRERRTLMVCLMLALLGVLVLVFQPYAGPWSILAGLMIPLPLMALCYLLPDSE